MIQRRILLLHPLNSCKTRFLSDKTRNRKWSLPPILPGSNLPTASTSKKAPGVKDSRFATTRPRSHSNKAKSSLKHPKLEGWAVQKLSRKQKYPEGYHPSRKVSPDAIEGIRILHRQRPQFTVHQLADFFKVSPEAISRILKSQWRPSPREQEDRIKRWNKRTQRIAEERIERKNFRQQSTALHRHRGTVIRDQTNQSTTRKHRTRPGVSEQQRLRSPSTRSGGHGQDSTLRGVRHQKRGSRSSGR